MATRILTLFHNSFVEAIKFPSAFLLVEWLLLLLFSFTYPQYEAMEFKGKIFLRETLMCCA